MSRGYRRQTVSRTATASCTVCPKTWTGTAALPAGTAHAVSSGHVTTGSWVAQYRYVPDRVVLETTEPCPVCGTSAYPMTIGPVHADGSANEPCWLAILRGEDGQ